MQPGNMFEVQKYLNEILQPVPLFVACAEPPTLPWKVPSPILFGVGGGGGGGADLDTGFALRCHECIIRMVAL